MAMNYLPGRNFRESDLILQSMNTVAKAENSINCFGSDRSCANIMDVEMFEDFKRKKIQLYKNYIGNLEFANIFCG